MRNCFTRKTSWFWQNAEKILIILFLATFTLNIRKVFLTPYSFLNGTFNEYLTMSFSWADALMIATIIIYTIKCILRQFKSPLSNLSETSQEGTIEENKKGYLSSVIHCITNVSRETYILLIFIAWCFISIIWSPYKPIAVYRCLTLLEILLFFFIAYKNLVANSRFLRISFVALIANGFIQAIIGILQFIYGHSLGLRLFGESIVSRETPGVAKLVIDGTKHIRAYGTFPHPNILAGFLIIPLVILLTTLLNRWWSKQFFNFSFEEVNQSKFVSRATILNRIPTSLILVFLFIIGLGFILAFSRSAFLGLFAALLFILYSFIRNLKYNKQISIVLLFIIIASVGSIYFISHNTSLFSDQSMKERNSYVNVARETISAHPLAGIGIGQFVFEEYSENPNLEGWQYQPVHNLYLLIFSELGIVGLIFFLLWIFSIMEWGIGKNGNTGVLLTNNTFCCIMFSFLIIALFDHYFGDIKTGTIIFSLIITFILLRNRNLAIN